MNSIDFQADHERLKWLAGCGTNDGPIRIGSVNLADAMELSLPAWNNVCGIRLSAADMLPERKDKSVLAPTLTHTEADAVLDCFGPWNPAVACGRRGR